MRKLITCIAAEDKAKEAVDGVAKTFGIQAMVNHFARGFGRSSALSTQKLGQQTEKTIISVIVDKKQADDVFTYIFHTAGLDRPHGGIIYMTAIQQAVTSPLAEIQSAEAQEDNINA
ncbi:MAG: P-II family nitrogen regulator [Ghiorsea sp.]|nr:P-II family nitrogen regulator [Ghiorsea sp.]